MQTAACTAAAPAGRPPVVTACRSQNGPAAHTTSGREPARGNIARTAPALAKRSTACAEQQRLSLGPMPPEGSARRPFWSQLQWTTMSQLDPERGWRPTPHSLPSAHGATPSTPKAKGERPLPCALHCQQRPQRSILILREGDLCDWPPSSTPTARSRPRLQAGPRHGCRQTRQRSGSAKQAQPQCSYEADDDPLRRQDR
mmetsp:Transcript_23283/g.74971  ORF Transcript_23283/g.74971 Transcript_23283/m.74971 type:complete len:200 (+) Transcript_23283:2766-3365(+)